MFESRSIEDRLTEDIPSSSSDNTTMDVTHILENLLDYDPENQEDSEFMQVF